MCKNSILLTFACLCFPLAGTSNPANVVELGSHCVVELAVGLLRNSTWAYIGNGGCFPCNNRFHVLDNLRRSSYKKNVDGMHSSAYTSAQVQTAHNTLNYNTTFPV
jgi:hypothetical protein